jgi:hypothetical protein
MAELINPWKQQKKQLVNPWKAPPQEPSDFVSTAFAEPEREGVSPIERGAAAVSRAGELTGLFGRGLAREAVTTLPKGVIAAEEIKERAVILPRPAGTEKERAEAISAIRAEKGLPPLEPEPTPEPRITEPAAPSEIIESLRGGIAKVERALPTEVPPGDRAAEITVAAARSLGNMAATLPVGGLKLMAAVSGLEKARQSLSEGESLPIAVTAGGFQTILTGLTEYDPTQQLRNTALPFFQRLLRGGVTDLVGELIETSGEMWAIDEKIRGKDAYTKEEWRRALENTAIVSGLVTGGATVVTEPGVRQRRRVEQAAETLRPISERLLTEFEAPRAEAPPPVEPTPAEVVPEPPLPEAVPPKPPKGKAFLSLSESERQTLSGVRQDVLLGDPQRKIFVREDEGRGKVTEVKWQPTTYPEYFQKRGFTKKYVLNAIDKVTKGQALTDKEIRTIEELNSGYRQQLAEDISRERGRPRTVGATELDVGDQYKQAGETFEVTEELDNGNIVVQDGGETKTLSPDDAVSVDRGTLKKKERVERPEEEFPPPPTTTAFARTREADIAGRYDVDRPLLELPEMVELTRSINEGKAPKLKNKLGRALGLLRSRRGERADIFLKKDIFTGDVIAQQHSGKDFKESLTGFKERVLEGIPEAERENIVFKSEYDKRRKRPLMKAYRRDPTLAPRVLSHEIGHLVDFLEAKDLRRGNILGRIASLKKFGKGFIDKMPLEIGKGKLTSGEQITQREITQELQNVTQAWSPFDPQADPAYTKYRYSSKELYAEAISVLANNPQLLQDTAPKFYESFQAYLGRKPNVKATFDELVSRGQDRGALIEGRIEGITEMARRGSVAIEERRQRRLSDLEPIKDTAMRWLIDDAHPILKTVRKQERAGVRDATRTRHAIEEINYISSEADSYFHENFSRVIQPAEAEGITSEDFHLYLFANRVANERKYIANPRGYTEASAQEILDALPERWGQEKFNRVEGYLRNWWDIRRREIIPDLEASGMFSDDVIARVKENERYARFNSIEHIENSLGRETASRIFHQEGMLGDTSNVFTNTILQDMSLIRAVRINEAKESVVDLLQFEAIENPGVIEDASMRYSQDIAGQVPVKSKDPKKDILTVMRQGKPKHYYVSKSIVDHFNVAPYEATRIAQVWAGMNNVV